MSTRVSLRLPVMLPAGPDCDRCVARLQDELSHTKGVLEAAVDRRADSLEIVYDPNVVTLERIQTDAGRIGAAIADRIDHQAIDLRGLDCPDCAGSIERSVRNLPGVLWASANFAAGEMQVEFERATVTLDRICKVASEHGVSACPIGMDAPAERETAGRRLRAWWGDRRRAATALGAALLTGAGFAAWHVVGAGAANALYGAAIVVGGWGTARGAWMAVRARAIDMNALMTLAVAGAVAIGDWFEGATVVALYGVGNLLQAYTLDRTRRSIRRLMDLSPATARVRRGEAEVDAPVEQVQVDETVIVLPGERIPMDGRIKVGMSAINEAPITGESVPAEKGPGDRVFAGTLNGPGAVEFVVSRPYRDTTLARITHYVEVAQGQRAPSQQFIDRFAAVYTPVVVALAVAVAIVPPLSGLGTGGWSEWFVRALSLLIIACPCALVISTPVAVVAAIGSASRAGALIKGGVYLEALGSLRAMLYDKTGTLTLGRFQVDEVVALDGRPAADLLAIAAALEERSEHPLAAAFVDAVGSDRRIDAQDVQARAGQGIRGSVGGRTYVLGNPGMLRSAGIALDGAAGPLAEAEASGRTAVLLADAARPLGLITLSDTPRAGMRQAIRDLAELGIEHQAMLTGDNERVAHAVATAVGLRDHRAGLLPEEKMEAVREVQRRHGPVGMVGDGVNDAPALAAADVGIVMGAVGSDTAIETADVALLSDDVARLPWLVQLSRRTRGIMRQNVAFSLATKGALVVAALFVGIPLWLAVLGDVGVSVLVTLNALRLMAVR